MGQSGEQFLVDSAQCLVRSLRRGGEKQKEKEKESEKQKQKQCALALALRSVSRSVSRSPLCFPL